MARPDSLASHQEAFAQIATTLDGLEPLLRSEHELASWIRTDRGIPASERIRVYANAYFARILAALREDFGALSAALGDDAFHDLAKLYLMLHPSRSFSLRFVGEHLPSFLSGPVGEPFRRRFPSAPDLAALEWAITDVFDAPDARVLERATLARLSPDAWPSLRFSLIPAHRILSLAWPVQRLRDAWSADAPLPEIAPGATTVLVHRRDERVFQRALSRAEATALSCVGDGEDFAAVCGRLAELDPRADVAARALELLNRWLADGILSAA